MRELVRTNDLVVLSCAQALLEEAGLACVVLDEHTGAALGLVSRRLMVADDNYHGALRALRDGGLGKFIYDPV